MVAGVLLGEVAQSTDESHSTHHRDGLGETLRRFKSLLGAEALVLDCSGSPSLKLDRDGEVGYRALGQCQQLGSDQG